MPVLRDNINNAVKDAMKARDERRVSTLRMMNAAIKNADIEARGQGKEPLNEADLMSLFQKMIKQRQESAELYEKGGRPELAAQEREEIAIISAYLPKQMSEDEVKAAINTSIFTPIRHTGLVRKVQDSLKRGVLLSGKFGTGKSMTSAATAYLATENKWTFIVCERADELAEVLRLALLLLSGSGGNGSGSLFISLNSEVIARSKLLAYLTR